MLFPISEAGAWILPIAEARAVMGERVKAHLERVAWRFELPTVLTINGEFYGRAEWEARAFAANDRVEFISLPLGSSSGGSTAKSILSVVTLLALTAVAGPAGPLGAALATAFGSVGGAVASAVIVGAGAAYVAPWLRPEAPWWRRALRRARDSFRAVLSVACRLWSPAP